MTPRGRKWRRRGSASVTRRHPDAPRFLHRGEGSGVERVFARHSLCRAQRILARSLTRLKCAEFRDDASVEEKATPKIRLCHSASSRRPALSPAGRGIWRGARVSPVTVCGPQRKNANNVLRGRRILARSLTRLKCAEFRDDASGEETATPTRIRQSASSQSPRSLQRGDILKQTINYG